ncbi:MAG: DNA mismatch endonuclease Vsr [Deltaproteobacteria bacterium]|nr:DNA mismatch endonuclease Vsr [Deltaproteobacteria bacterium]
MSDTFSPEKRSWIMSQVRSQNTTPEMLIRSLTHRLGYRYRLHSENLPGKPDLVFPSRRKALFVHGCFWHGHDCSRGARIPKSNSKYWIKKIGRNKERDQENKKLLESLGWSVLVLWECQTNDLDNVKIILEDFLG